MWQTYEVLEISDASSVSFPFVSMPLSSLKPPAPQFAPGGSRLRGSAARVVFPVVTAPGSGRGARDGR